MIFCQVEFTGNDGNQKFLYIAPVLRSLILDRNKKVTNWMSTGISLKKFKPFDTNLKLTMSNLANGIEKLKFNNFVLVQKGFSSLDSNFILNLQIAYEFNTWPRNPTNNFTLIIVYLVQ